MATLYGVDLERGSVWTLSVSGDSFTLGCSPRAGVPIADRTLASHELVIARRDGRFIVRALATQAGFRLNDQPLALEEETPLGEGDCLHGGRTVVVFYGGEVEPSVAMRRLRDAQRRALPSDAVEAPAPRSPLPALLLCLVLGAAIGFVAVKLFRSDRGEPLSRDIDRLVEELDVASDDDLARSLEELAAVDFGGDDEPLEGNAAEPRAPRADTAEDSPETSRRRLFRLAIDLLGRPPTRAEEVRWLPLSHRERWEALFDPSRLPEDVAGDGIAAVFDHFLAARPDEDALAELAPLVDELETGELWDRVGRRLAASERYGSREFRRPRDGTVLGRSLIVDLLDRPPRSETESELATRAFAGAPLAAARTLAYAAAPHGKQVELAAEFFRFAGRWPEATETAELERILSGARSEDAARWLPLALVLLEEYGTY